MRSSRLCVCVLISWAREMAAEIERTGELARAGCGMHRQQVATSVRAARCQTSISANSFVRQLTKENVPASLKQENKLAHVNHRHHHHRRLRLRLRPAN